MEIVRARPTEAAALSLLAQRAKAHWGYPAAWLEQWRAQLTITPDFVAQHEVFTGRGDGQPVGFYALAPDEEESLRLEHLWVEPKWMGQGLGRRLFGHASARARVRGFSRLTIESDPHAEAFYLHLGARRIGTRRSEIQGQARELPLLCFALDGGAR